MDYFNRIIQILKTFPKLRVEGSMDVVMKDQGSTSDQQRFTQTPLAEDFSVILNQIPHV
jgi:hypothetical protein